MKYIKTFEKLDRTIKKGDYAIINFDTTNPEVTDFFKNNICKIIDVRKGSHHKWIQFGYENVPDELIEWFNKKSGKYYIYHIDLNICDVQKYSKNKEELELELQANKFNL